MVRIFNVFMGFFLVFILLPLFIIISILVKISSKGSIFYLDTRVGLDNKEFSMYKFRTMYTNIKNNENWFTQKNDIRVTGIGKWLRRSSLDEIPQLFNVIKGDMSLVGPRPESPFSKSLYSKEYWIEVHKIRPGITGLAQVNGRSALGLNQKIKFDLLYVSNTMKQKGLRNLFMDIAILFKTFSVLLMRNTN